MDYQENTQEQSKKRKRAVPLIFWFGGALVTGGLIVFAWLNSKNAAKAENLEQQLASTETRLNDEKQALIDKLDNTTASYETLQAEHEAVVASFSNEQARNSRLATSNANALEREKELKSKYDAQLDTTNRLKTEYLVLMNEAGILRSNVENLQAQLRQSEQVSSEQASLIQKQNEIIRTDSITAKALIDSIMREDVAGYFNNTYATGAYGLRYRNLPNSEYFFGFNTINGYVINKNFMTGIGVGLYSYNGGRLMAPLYIDLRYTFGRRNFTPYLFADGGLLLNFDDFDSPSLFINPGIGLTKRLGNHFDLNLGAGIFTQMDKYIRHSFVNVKLGVIYRKK